MNPTNTDPNLAPQDGVTPNPAPVTPVTPVDNVAQPTTPTSYGDPSVNQAAQVANPFATPAEPAPAAPIDPLAAPATPEVSPAGAPAAPAFGAPAPEAAPGAVPAFGAQPAPGQPLGTAPQPGQPLGSTPLGAPGAPAPVTPVATGPLGFLKNLKNNAKLMRIAVGAGSALLLVVIGVIAYFTFGTVSQADYREALAKYNDVAAASQALLSDASDLGYATSKEDSSYDTALSDAKDTLASLKTENEALGKLKASRLGESGKLYKAFDDKVESYLTYADGLITSVENLHPAMVTCSDTSSDDQVTYYNNCAGALAKVTDIPNESFKNYVTVLKDNYAKMAAAYEGISGLSDPYGSQYSQYTGYRDSFYAASDAISSASTEFSDSLDASDAKYSPKDTGKAYADFLEKNQ